jgi:hypothetical protein
MCDCFVCAIVCTSSYPHDHHVVALCIVIYDVLSIYKHTFSFCAEILNYFERVIPQTSVMLFGHLE